MPLPSKLRVSRFMVLPLLQRIQAWRRVCQESGVVLHVALVATEKEEGGQGGRESVVQPANSSARFQIFSRGGWGKQESDREPIRPVAVEIGCYMDLLCGPTKSASVL